MQIFFIVLGVLGIIWCILPRLIYSVLNIGNITGLVVFTCFLLIGLFWKPLKKLVLIIWKKKQGKIALVIAGVVLSIIPIFVIVETICMVSVAGNKPEGNETVVVLGSYVKKSGPSIMSTRRLEAAFKYLTEHPDAVCIVTGGQGKDEPWPEADAFKDYLVNKGISEERIYKERESTNTRENLKFALEIINENGLNDKIVIISNEFHLYRAGRIADRLGINHCYVSASSPAPMFSAYYIRELYAILADWFVYS